MDATAMEELGIQSLIWRSIGGGVLCATVRDWSSKAGERFVTRLARD